MTVLDGSPVDESAAAQPPLLAVDGLCVAFPGPDGWVTVVDEVSFEVARSETLGLVGESGCGKSVTSSAILGLTRLGGGRITAGSIRFEGEELRGAPERVLRARRGRDIAMVFQQAAQSLDPAFTVGDQIAEPLRVHLGMSRKAARGRVVELLERVHIPDAARRARDYPHTFSGGMLQRVMIAMAIACGPKLLIADEPTTALDVRVQASVLELLAELQRELGISVVFVSHDLAVIAEVCDRVAVMYAGQIVEQGRAEDVFVHPRHPYTEGLLASIPSRQIVHRHAAIPGRVPNPAELPTGCRFHPRCRYVVAGLCDAAPPPMVTLANGAQSRCARVAELTLSGITVP